MTTESSRPLMASACVRCGKDVATLGDRRWCNWCGSEQRKAVVRPVDHEERMHVARAWSAWHFGDPRWADRFIDVYANPDAVLANLRELGADVD